MIIVLKELLEHFVIDEGLAMGLSIAIVTIAILVTSYLANFITKRFLVNLIRVGISKISLRWGAALLEYKVIHILSNFAPALVIYFAANLYDIPDIPATDIIVNVLQKITQAWMLFILAVALNSCVNSIEYVYSFYDIAKRRPIKSYLQVMKILVIVITVILIISTLMDTSPIAFFTGLGAMMAVVVLVFKDSIMGFIASIQLSAYDMVRIGDWIQMDNFGADGDVIDIALNTVKVRNFDNTITTIPTYALMSYGVKNWRGMQESGGRRIKRSINIDKKTIKFCDNQLLDKLEKVDLISDYIKNKRVELVGANKNILHKDLLINGRALTNLGCFRAYINAYLRKNTNIHHSGFTFLVRQLPPTEKGLPLEIYSFCKNINWVAYEEIQADIFDHLLAAVSLFDLQVYQNFSGKDLENIIRIAPEFLHLKCISKD